MQELTFDPENDVHILNALPDSVDIGNYVFVLEVMLHLGIFMLYVILLLVCIHIVISAFSVMLDCAS